MQDILYISKLFHIIQKYFIVYNKATVNVSIFIMQHYFSQAKDLRVPVLSYANTLKFGFESSSGIITIDKSTWIYHIHSNSIVFIRVQPWCWTTFGFEECAMSYFRHSGIMLNTSTVLKICSAYLSFLCALTSGHHQSCYHLHNFAFSRMWQSWNFIMCIIFQLTLFLISNMYLKFLHVFSWFDNKCIFYTE